MHFVRYEDVILSPAETYAQMFRFLLDLDDVSGTNAERRINEIVSGGVKTYKLKHTTG